MHRVSDEFEFGLDQMFLLQSYLNAKINVVRSITWSFFFFYLIFIKLADKQHIHKISDEFELGPDPDYSLQSYLPMTAKINVFFFFLSIIYIFLSELHQTRRLCKYIYS